VTLDVSVIGIGRIGLPLALSFADRGLQVLGVDADPERLAAVAEGRMPFEEPGAQDVLDRVHASGRLELTDSVADAAKADNIVITLGTPSFSHIEIDIRDIRSALDDLLPHLRQGQTIVLRSTVAPGTTDFVAGYIAKHLNLQVGEDVFVAHVPERIAAGRFLEEIDTLPCIVGGVGAASGERAAQLFETFNAPITQTSPVQAELAKIWTNILRYTTFALPNLLMMDCEQHGANVFEVIDLINRDYPRGGIASPGLTAGTCLRKDFAFSEERSAAPGMLLAVSRVNESVPLFLVEGMKRRLGALSGRKVAVLGLAFKADTDDERDSLAHKLIRLLERELADVAIHDPQVATPTQAFDDAVRDADAVVVATNHSAFRGPEPLARIADLAKGDPLVVDPWNCFGAAQVFGYASENFVLGLGDVAGRHLPGLPQT
jgi:UDP-N-acetyl-D-mannosaminuronic acid dehydrogenase